MKYLGTVFLRLFKRDAINNGLIIIVITFALLIPSIFISQYLTAQNNIVRYTELIVLDSNALVIRTNNPSEDEKKLISNTITSETITETYYRKIRIHTPIVLHKNGFLVERNLYTISDNFNYLFQRTPLVEGEWVSDKFEAVIGHSLLLNDNIQTGDVLYVGAQMIRVVGVFDIPTMNDSILFSEYSVENYTMWSITYFVSNADYFNDSIFSEALSIDIITIADFYSNLFDRLSTGWNASIILASIALMYGIIKSVNECVNFR